MNNKLILFFLKAINKQMKLLQSQPKLIEIETRLNKESYLSRGNLPGSADARMFLFLESIKRYPDRKSYPNFYHWYILMKQFAISSMEKWISNNMECLEEDQLIGDFITRTNERMNLLTDTQLVKKNSAFSDAIIQDIPTYKTTAKQSQQPFANPTTNSLQLEYIMDVKIIEGTKSNVHQLVADFLFNQQIQTPEIQQLLEERRVRIVAKMDPEKYQQIKNQISSIEGVETFQSKKKDKRFMTNNSANNNFLLSEIS